METSKRYTDTFQASINVGSFSDMTFRIDGKTRSILGGKIEIRDDSVVIILIAADARMTISNNGFKHTWTFDEELIAPSGVNLGNIKTGPITGDNVNVGGYQKIDGNLIINRENKDGE